MRTLAIDYGEKRIGLAVSDPLGMIARGLEVLIRKDTTSDITYLCKLIGEHQVSEIVIGLPLNMNGTQGKKAEEVLEFVEQLKEHCDVPIQTWDERLTTMQSERILLEADVSRSKRKKVIDKLAATCILQSYLDYKSSGQ